MARSSYMGIGVALGTAIGVALGIAMDNLALGIGGGIAIGVALGAGFDASRKGKKDKGSGSEVSLPAVIGTPSNVGEDLYQTLQTARDLLLARGENQWADNFDRAARLLADDELKGVEAVLGFFGGMGSLTDRLPIDDGPDYDRLKVLVDRAHELAYRRSKALGL